MSCPCSEQSQPWPILTLPPEQGQDGAVTGVLSSNVTGDGEASPAAVSGALGLSLPCLVLLSRSCNKGKRQRTWRRSETAGGGSGSAPRCPATLAPRCGCSWTQRAQRLRDGRGGVWDLPEPDTPPLPGWWSQINPPQPFHPQREVGFTPRARPAVPAPAFWL